MKKDAVQNERDRISSRKPTQEEMHPGANTGTFKVLHFATCKSLAVIYLNNSSKYHNVKESDLK